MSRTIIIKGTYTKISRGGHSMYSNESIITTAGKEVTETGVGKGVSNGEPKDPPIAEIDILADAIVHFRPMKDWKGKDYGFDWMRIGDSGLPGEVNIEILWVHTTHTPLETIQENPMPHFLRLQNLFLCMTN